MACARERVGQQGSKICQHPFDCLAVIQRGWGREGENEPEKGEALENEKLSVTREAAEQRDKQNSEKQ